MLDETDRRRLEYVYSGFHRAGLRITFPFSSPHWGARGAFPTLKDLILQRDSKRNLGDCLAPDDDYALVRDLQESNRIIFVWG